MADPHQPTDEAPDGHHRLDSPIVADPAAGAGWPAWRWATGIIATAALLLAAFDADGIGGWFDELTPSVFSEPLRAPVERWRAATAPLDGPRAWLRARWTGMRAARFGHEQPGEHGEAAGG